ncbi:MAG: VWA domain-containing protein [Thermoanaerobaculia bacterium]
MRSRPLASLAAVFFALSAAALLAQAPPEKVEEKKKAELKTKVGTFPLEVTVEYLGMAKGKTVARFKMAAPELSRGASGRGVKTFQGELRGSLLQKGEIVEAFKYPVAGELVPEKVFTYSFLRGLAPGSWRMDLALGPTDGPDFGKASVDLVVPELGTVFSPEMTPGEAGTLPSAEAVVLTESAEAVRDPAAEPKLKIRPPSREAPVGLMRLEADVEPPIVKVEFYLGDRRVVSRTRPPYSVEIDLGEVPREQTLRAVGYDESGRIIDEDAWAINAGAARLTVRVLPRVDPSEGKVIVKVAVQSISGGVARKVELFLDSKKIREWTAPPFEATIAYADYSKAAMLRATAITDEGKEANDIKMLRGPSVTVESVRVDVVQLHVSALDKAGHFIKGLAKEDFAVKEDGKPQPMTGFEVAENLPLTIGLVVDSSGSMEKSIPFVRDAGATLFKNMIRAKDQGFVIEFREQAKFLQEMTSDSTALQRAARDVRAGGATALYDAIVLGLYQFRAQQGRKALVVVTDGADNFSHVEYATLLRYARSAGAPIFLIGLGIPMLDFGSRKALNEIGSESGGEAFFLKNATTVGEIASRIEEELRSQYILAFRSFSQKPPGEYRAVAVAIAKPGLTARTVRGYIP